VNKHQKKKKKKKKKKKNKMSSDMGSVPDQKTRSFNALMNGSRRVKQQ